MELKSSINIARALIARYGEQAEAVAEQRAGIMAHEDPGLRHVWEQVPLVVSELRRSDAMRMQQPGAPLPHSGARKFF